jgi:hypothetical protein
MSLLSSFLSHHLIPALEAAFVANAPEIQEALIHEMKQFAGEINDWIESKMSGENDAAN